MPASTASCIRNVFRPLCLISHRNLCTILRIVFLLVLFPAPTSPLVSLRQPIPAPLQRQIEIPTRYHLLVTNSAPCRETTRPRVSAPSRNMDPWLLLWTATLLLSPLRDSRMIRLLLFRGIIMSSDAARKCFTVSPKSYLNLSF